VPDPEGSGREGVGDAGVEIIPVVVAVTTGQRVEAKPLHELKSIAILLLLVRSFNQSIIQKLPSFLILMYSRTRLKRSRL
jgi:hypothetical protein